MRVNKWQMINDRLRTMPSLAVAFSGGVDSSLLLMLAKEILDDKVVAVTFASPLMPKSELEEAKIFARGIGVRHEIIESDDLAIEELRENGKERCYFCKKKRFEQAIAWADSNDIKYIAEGSNLDDMEDFRPGMRILTELSPRLLSPFLEAGIRKRDIREKAKKMSLPNWNKPSAACLASRIEYDTELTVERLAAVEKAEDYLRQIIKGQLRVRNHGVLARIETSAEEIPSLVERSAEINEALKKFGFLYVTVDLAGYRQGSQNEIFLKKRFS